MANAWVIKPLPMTVTASTTHVGSPAYLGNDYLGMIWRANASIPILYIDLGADTAVDTVMLFDLVGPTRGATASIRGATAAEGASYTSREFGYFGIYAGTVPQASGKGVSIIQVPTTWPAIRYLQIQFGATGGYAQVGRVVVGKRLVLARNFGFGGAFGVRDLGSIDFGPLATFLRRRGARLRTVGVTFSNAYRDEVEGAIAPLIETCGATSPIALVTDPAADPMRERRCWFGPMVGDLGYVQRNAVGWEWKASVIDLSPILP